MAHAQNVAALRQPFERSSLASTNALLPGLSILPKKVARLIFASSSRYALSRGIGIYTNTRSDFTLPLGGSSDSEGRAEDAQAMTATES